MIALKKYAEQSDKHSCAPVALYNFLVWAKTNPVPSDLVFLSKLMRATPEQGTDFDLVLNFMRLFEGPFDINVYNTRSIIQAIKTVQNKGAFFVVYDSSDDTRGHIAFCRGIVNGKLSLINAVVGSKDLQITKQQFKNMCMNNSVAPIFITMRGL